MNVRKICFSLAITFAAFASVVSAQNTHMGVTPDNMVILGASCSTKNLSDCDVTKNVSWGSKWDRILSDGSRISDFKIPERKILVITEYEWKYSESIVLEESANEPVQVFIAYSGMPSFASVLQSNLTVTPQDPLSTQGHAYGSSQLTSGFVMSVLPDWRLNRSLSDDPSNRSFFIILRGYLLTVP